MSKDETNTHDETVAGASADAEAPGQEDMAEASSERAESAAEAVEAAQEADEPIAGASAEAEAPGQEDAAESQPEALSDASPEHVEAAAEAVEAAQEADEPIETLVPEETAEPSDPSPGASAAAEAPAAAESPTGAPKQKRKRLPRALRPRKTRPKRPQSKGRKPIVRLEKPGQERGRRQERQGTVVSDAMDKTIVVSVDVIKAHPKYKKVVRRSTKFHAHDERNEAKVGDVVRIVETRPLSKQKRWRLAEVLEVAK
jgi:small subunit ribosomal protein S17